MREKKLVTKKQFCLYIFICIFLFVLAMTLLFLIGLFDGGISNILGFSSLGLLVLDVIFAISQFSKMMEYEARCKALKLEKVSSIEFSYKNQNEIANQCEALNYKKLQELYYHKRRFHFFKDFVNYFVRTCDYQDMKETINRELLTMDSYHFKHKNKCLLLFLYKDEVTCFDLKQLEKFSSDCIVSEQLAGNLPHDSILCVLLSNEAKKAFIFPSTRVSFQLYHAGYKQVKRILKN